jgi:glycosyltransferase 2 family protein
VVVRTLRRHWMIAVALLALLILVLVVDPIQLGRVLRDADGRFVGLMVPCVLTLYVFRSLAWRVTLRQIGVPISIRRAIYVMVAGQTLIFLPGGDLGRVPILEESGAGGHDEGEVTSTIAFDALIFLLLMGLALVPALPRRPELGALVFVLLLAQVGVFVVLLWKPLYDRSVNLVERLTPLQRFDKQLRHLRPAFLELFTVRTLFGVVLFNAAAVLLSFVLFELALHAVHVTSVGFAEAAFIYALGHILSGLSMLPGGLGVYEGILTGVLATQHVPPAIGAVAALLYRGFNDVFMAILGFGAIFLLRRLTARRGRHQMRAQPLTEEAPVRKFG